MIDQIIGPMIDLSHTNPPCCIAKHENRSNKHDREHENVTNPRLQVQWDLAGGETRVTKPRMQVQ